MLCSTYRSGSKGPAMTEAAPKVIAAGKKLSYLCSNIEGKINCIYKSLEFRLRNCECTTFGAKGPQTKERLLSDRGPPSAVHSN